MFHVTVLVVVIFPTVNKQFQILLSIKKLPYHVDDIKSHHLSFKIVFLELQSIYL